MNRNRDRRGSAALVCGVQEKEKRSNLVGKAILEKRIYLPEIKEGYWILKYAQRLRGGPGLNYRGDVSLEAGSRMYLREIRYLSISVWGKTSEGWVCLYMSGKWYIE